MKQIQPKEDQSSSGSYDQSHEKNSSKRHYKKKSVDKVRRWTQQEHELYEKFVKMYSDIMQNSTSKRNTKIFLLMSNFIVTKTPSQCRSHHQKFYNKIFSEVEVN